MSVWLYDFAKRVTGVLALREVLGSPISTKEPDEWVEGSDRGQKPVNMRKGKMTAEDTHAKDFG